MYTDLVDSTSFKERVGEEESLQVLRDHFRLLRTAVQPYQGKLWKLLGDGMLASFPSTKDAVHAAVAIQRKVAQYNRRRASRKRMPAVRIGIDSGDVNIVDLGENREDLIGRVVDRCSRICAMAEGDHILVTDDGNALEGWVRQETQRRELRVAKQGKTQWKGGGTQKVTVKEVLYRRSTSTVLLPKQEALRSGQRIIRNQVQAYRIAAKLIKDAKTRLLVAVRTLPIVTGMAKHPGDDELEYALSERLEQFGVNPKNQPRTILMFSAQHTRNDITKLRDKQPTLRDVRRRIENTLSLAKGSHGRLRLTCVDDLANPLVVADDSYGIWVLFKSQAPITQGEPGLGLFSVGQAESQRVWEYMTGQSGPGQPTSAELMRKLAPDESRPVHKRS